MAEQTITVTNEQELETALVTVFQLEYGKVIATKISEHFLEFCTNNGLDWDLIVDEFQIEDTDDSLIMDAIDDILTALNEDGFGINQDTKEKEKLYKLLQSIKPIDAQINEITNTNQQNNKLNDYKETVYQLFELRYKKQKWAKQAVEALDAFMGEETFEFDDLVQDLSHNAKSICVSALCDSLQWTNTNNILSILLQALGNDTSTQFNARNITLNVEEKDKEAARAQFRALCPSIFVAEHNTLGDLAIIKAIEMKNGNHGLLLLLWDTWTRYKIENDCLTMDVSTFWDKKYKYNNFLKKHHKIADIDHLKYGLQAFNKRILSSVSPNYVIYDSLPQFVNYTIAASQFIDLFFKPKLDNKEQNTLPLLFDFWIIPQCSKKRQQIIEVDADDDDDSDGEQDEKEEPDGAYCYLGYGGVDALKKSPIHSIGHIGTYLIKRGYVENTDFVCTQIKLFATISAMKRRFLELYKAMNKHNETHKRFIFIVDRRSPEHYLHRALCGDAEKVKSKMDGEKDWPDLIYCIEDRAVINKNYMQFPEVFFELSRNCMLPMEMKNDRIGIIHGLNGYMFNLSFHLQSEDIAKCYWSRNGEIRRFFKRDIKQCWPQHFIQTNENNNQRFDESLLINLYKDLRDDKFKLFYYETTSDMK